MNSSGPEAGSDAAGSGWRPADALLLVGAAVLAIAAVEVGYSPRLSFSDEIVYATIGRNLAEGRGLIAGHYHPLSIVEHGYPSLYVHMPGHPMLLAASFRLFGSAEWSAFVPSWISYAAAAAAVYGLGLLSGGRRAGILGGLLFLAYPAVLSLSVTVMSEPSLILIVALYALGWLQAWRSPRWWWGGVLGGGLVIGMLHHETLLALLPPTLALGLRTSGRERWALVGCFAFVVAAGAALVLWPAHLARAPYPHFARDVLGDGDPRLLASRMWANLTDNVLDLFRSRGGASGTLRTQFPFLAMAGVLACWRWLAPPSRGLLAFGAAVFGLTFLGMAPFYPMVKLGPRPLILVSPVLCAVAGAALASARPPRLATAATLLVLGSTAWVSAQDVVYMMQRQSGSLRFESRLSRTIRERTRGLEVRGALVENAFLYGWDAFPVTVVAFGNAVDPKTFDAVDRKVPLDVVALPERGSSPRPPLLETHLLARDYRPLGHADGLWLYAASRLFEDAPENVGGR